MCGNKCARRSCARRIRVARQSDEHVEGGVLGDAVLFREKVDGLGDDFARSQVFLDLIAGVGRCAASVSEFVAVQEGFPSLGEANAGLLIRRERGPDR